MPFQPLARTLLAVCAATLVHTTTATAQSSVALSFRAVSDAGQPVRDLKPADVSIKLDGKPREVRSLELVSMERTAGAAGPARPGYASNAGPDRGRDIILVIDDESIAPGREAPVQNALRQIIERLTPSDRVGVLSLRSGGTSVAATADRGAIGRLIDDFKGQAQVSESLSDFQCRTSLTLQSVKGLLSTATDAKTTFVLVSSGMAPIPAEQARTSLGSSSGLCQLRPSHFSDVGQAAQGSPAAVYVLNAVEGRANTSMDAQAGLESLAGVTGARVIRLAASNTPGVDRIADETAAYYVASFSVEPNERNGSAHKTEVRVNRPGVKTMAGTSLLLPKAGGKSPKDMIRSADAFRDLPLRATGWAMRDAGSKLKILALFEPAEPGVKLGSAMIALIDGSRIAAQWTAQSAELERIPTIAAILAPPGNYRLRVAATDSTGRAGAVDYPLPAQLTSAGPVTLSGVALGVPSETGFKTKVLFGPEDQGAMGYLEVYGVPKGAQVAGSIELAPSETAPAMATTPASVQPASAEDMRIVAGGFSIGGLQPGDYVMRFVISVDGKVVGTALRTMTKSGK